VCFCSKGSRQHGKNNPKKKGPNPRKRSRKRQKSEATADLPAQSKENQQPEKKGGAGQSF